MELVANAASTYRTCDCFPQLMQICIIALLFFCRSPLAFPLLTPNTLDSTSNFERFLPRVCSVEQRRIVSKVLGVVSRVVLGTGIATAAWLGSADVLPGFCDGPPAMVLSSATLTSVEMRNVAMVSFTSPPGDDNQQTVNLGCLAKNCGKELAKSLMDPRGAREIFCLSTCAADDTSCQLRCINLYEDPNVLKDFQTCILGKNRCLPQRNDVGKNWVPAPSQLISDFDKQAYSGQWYVTHGMNPNLDCYKCQMHNWVEEDGLMKVNIQYKVESPDKKKLFSRLMSERFVQNKNYPGVLQATDETDLHQGDDWYILGGDPQEFMIIYYIGCNDSWCGYNGGNVYSRNLTLSPKAEKEVQTLTKRLGLNFSTMCPIENDITYCSY